MNLCRGRSVGGQQILKNPELAQEWLDYVTNKENSETLYELTSEIPANQEARTVVSESGNELTKAVIEQFNTAVPMPNIPEMSEVWTGAETMIFDAASGNKSRNKLQMMQFN